MNIERHGTTPRYSDVVAYGHAVHLVEVAQTLDADITRQTREVLASIERLLILAGSDKSRLLQVTIYLADIADIGAMNAVWDDWVPAGSAPARACIEARLAKPGYRIEVVVIAAR
jgi:enamine deaminase RidA (YjgF/YER057c/UK114 family)